MKRRILTILDRCKYFGLRWAYYNTIRLFSRMHMWCVDAGVFGDPAGTIFNKRIARTLVTDFNGDSGHNIQEGTTFPGFGLIHYALLRAIKPDRVLCIGSRQGFIPAILAMALKDNGKGCVDFVDAGFDDDAPDRNWSGIGFWRKVDPAAHFGRLGLTGYIATHVMTTAAFAKRYPRRRYDYVYIDGDHSDKGVRLDYALFAGRVRPGGFVSFHDIVARGMLGGGEFGVYRLWDKIKRKTAIDFPFPSSSGLGIAQKAYEKASLIRTGRQRNEKRRTNR